MTCRGFQYEEGKEYTTDKAKLCESGFHACEYPLDCLNYYNPAESEYHSVDLDAADEKQSNDTKRVGKRIKVGAKLSVKNLVEASIEYINEHKDYVVCGNTMYLGIEGKQPDIARELLDIKKFSKPFEDVLSLKPIYMKD